ncbi:3-keto-disaccharide hydrolase [Bryobacter aggregatus]|uniref:3-keto-disaccharide hydrolase n=1 Tax=Bryobacter aggregatus TaxID=360054 RepID=UPI0004E1A96C|nr:DUF1080 domain-containing protein [Bryobacter aggregatus]
MNRRSLFSTIFASTAAFAQQAKDPKRFNQATGYSDTPIIPFQRWKVHDIDRPKPPVVTPANVVGGAPSDAIVLFDGSDLSQWTFRGKTGRPRQSWKLENGTMEVVPGAGDAQTKESFGDVQLHVEWSPPTEISGDSQWRANSGILIMGNYEIQVLDSYNNPTYADGQAGAVYGQYPPLVNAVRKPGEWNSYDIIWEAPKFVGPDLAKPAYVTVMLNGILVQHRKEVIGRVAHRVVGTYQAHAPELPLSLQDHDVPVRYRNIWARRLVL